MSSISAIASMPAKPPPMKANVSMRLRRSWSQVDDATSIRLMTWLRTAMASSTFLKPIAFSARPGMGSVRETEPRPTIRWS